MTVLGHMAGFVARFPLYRQFEDPYSSTYVAYVAQISGTVSKSDRK